MFNPEKSTDVVSNSKYTDNSEVNRVFNVFDSFREDNKESQSQSAITNDGDNELSVLAMSSIGKLGRFGNQLFQYAFLRICAENSGAKVECSPWIGQTLFGHQDSQISQRLPPAIEQKLGEKNLFDVVPEFTPYLEKLASSKSIRIFQEDALNCKMTNVDLWGFFQFHTKNLNPYRDYFVSLFQPVPSLKSELEQGLNILRSKGKTIIGIHIRQGDYITEPQLNFTLVFPSRWYIEWLEKIWNTLEDPILFIATDNLDSIQADFEQFSPVISQDLGVKLPETMQDLNIDFYIDFYMLSHCDVVCTSNSIFSFAACMLNNNGQVFFRPHWDFSTKFTTFDPWNSEPLLRLESQKMKSKISKSLGDMIYVTYVTQGMKAMLKALFIYYPKNRIRGWGVRVYLGYQTQGFLGAFKSVLYSLGYHSIWNN